MNRQTGFSLLEILIAIFVLAFLMIGVSQTVSNSINTKDSIVEEDKNFLLVEAALARFQTDFSQIFTPLFYSRKHDPKVDPYNYGKADDKIYRPNNYYNNHPRFKFVSYEGHPVPIFRSEDKSHFEFFTASNRRRVEEIPQSTFGWVSYFSQSMEENEDKEEDDQRNVSEMLQLVRQYTPENIYAFEDEHSESKIFVLLDNLKSFEISYWNSKDKKWKDTVQKVENGEFLIRAVKVNLVWVDKNLIEYPIERIYRSTWPEFEPEDLSSLYKTQGSQDQDLVDAEDGDDDGDGDGGEAQ